MSGLAAFQLKLRAPEIGVPADDRNPQCAARGRLDQGGKVDVLGTQQFFLAHAALAEFDRDCLPDLGPGYRSPGRPGILSMEKSARQNRDGKSRLQECHRESPGQGPSLSPLWC